MDNFNTNFLTSRQKTLRIKFAVFIISTEEFSKFGNNFNPIKILRSFLKSDQIFVFMNSTRTIQVLS